MKEPLIPKPIEPDYAPAKPRRASPVRTAACVALVAAGLAVACTLPFAEGGPAVTNTCVTALSLVIYGLVIRFHDLRIW